MHVQAADRSEILATQGWQFIGYSLGFLNHPKKIYDMTVPVGVVGRRSSGLSSRDFCFPN